VAELPASEIRSDRRLALARRWPTSRPATRFEGQLTSQLLTVHGMAMDCVRAARDTLKEERVRLAYLSQRHAWCRCRPYGQAGAAARRRGMAGSDKTLSAPRRPSSRQRSSATSTRRKRHEVCAAGTGGRHERDHGSGRRAAAGCPAGRSA